MRVLVTGSSGLVGERLVALLRERGHGVVEFDLRDPVPRDIRSRTALDEALKGCDGVIHLAAIARVAWGEVDPDLCHDVNVGATALLLERMRAGGVEWLVFASSREVYGNTASRLVVESHPIAPLNAYGRSKAAAEKLIMQAASAGLKTSIIRLSNVYGTVNDHPDRAIPALLCKGLRDEPITLTGGETYFDFVHVDDGCRGLLAAALRLRNGSSSLPPIHLTTGTATTLTELARLALALSGSTASVAIIAPRSFDVDGFCGDPILANDLLAWSATISLADGMQRLLTDLRKLEGRMREVRMPD